MSNSNFESVETTLRNLKDIVDRNHSDSRETGQLVDDMERLIADLKSKTRESSIFDKLVENTTVAMPSPTPVIV